MQLQARSSLECRLYIEMHPHGCGDARSNLDHELVSGDDGLVAVYAGDCPGCGRAGRFEAVRVAYRERLAMQGGS